MTEFTDYMRQRLTPNGYRVIKQTTDDLFLRSPEDDMIWVMYLNAAIEPEQIRRAFDFQGHLLFVVNEKLIPDEIESREATPMWLRTLHGLYMGRVYVWNGRGVYGLHFDYEAGEISESSFLQFDALLLVETGTWLRGWPGTFKLARFWDKAWWTDVDWTKDAGYQTRDRRQSSEDFRRQYYGNWTSPNDDQQTNPGDSGYQSNGYAEWRREWRRQQEHTRKHWQEAQDRYSTNDDQRTKQEPPRYSPPPQQEQIKRDFMREFMACANAAAAKSLYRQLSKEFHPDLNPGRDTTATMQQINAAWDKAQRFWT